MTLTSTTVRQLDKRRAALGQAMLAAERTWLADITDRAAFARFQRLERRYERASRRDDQRIRRACVERDRAINRSISLTRLRTRCRRPVTRAARSIGVRSRASRPSATSTGDPGDGDPEPPSRRRTSSSGGASC